MPLHVFEQSVRFNSEGYVKLLETVIREMCTWKFILVAIGFGFLLHPLKDSKFVVGKFSIILLSFWLHIAFPWITIHSQRHNKKCMRLVPEGVFGRRSEQLLVNKYTNTTSHNLVNIF